MKLLSWMQRFSRKDSRSLFDGSVTGGSCVSLLGKQTPNSRGGHDVPSFNSNMKSPESDYFAIVNVGSNQKFNQSENEEIFPGFLTIGTLSLEPAPTFDSPQQRINELEKTEIKYDLNLINEELEKFLKAEAEKEERDELPREKGQATTHTLADEVKDEEGLYDAVKMHLYPLQGYLLGSTTEHTESRKKVKKEKRPSHKLSKSNKIMDRSPHKEDEESKKPAAEEIKKSGVMNKMLRTPPPCPKVPTASAGCATAHFSSLAKIKKLFRQKMHPEFGKATKDPQKFSEHVNKNMVNQSSSGLSSKHSGTTSLMNGKELYSTTDMKHPQDDWNYALKEMTGTGREHWIRTDAEYLVLEL